MKRGRIFDPKQYTVAALARTNGLKPETVYSRRRIGWDWVKTLSTPEGGAPTIKAMARAAGLSADTVYHRIRNGVDLTTALSRPSQRGPQSIAAQARRVGLSPGTVRGRINKSGCSLKQALTAPLPPHRRGQEESERALLRTVPTPPSIQEIGV